MLFSKKDLQKLIIPLMFEQLLAVSVGMVDTLMVSQAGEAAISGVALVDNINRLIIQVMAALATGGAVVCSQFVGKGKEEGAKKSGAQLETVLLVFSVCMTLLSLIGTRGLLHAVFGNVSEDVMDSAVLYFTVTSLSFPFLGIYNAGAAIFRSIGNSKISMQISLLMNVINIVGNAIFVFGFHWAVFGVALATLLSRIVAGIVITLLVCGKTNPIRIDKWSELKPDGSILCRFITIHQENVEYEQYLYIGVTLKNTVDASFTYEKLIRQIMEEMQIDTEVNVNLKGQIHGALTDTQKEQFAQDMLDMMNAKLSVGRHMEDVYTVYAYNKGIKNYIMIGKDKVNVNICIGYDEEKNETTVYLATPMNMQDY